ncbi:MAG: XTP/dITP diphosphatase [Clostridia bacterium]|nr:XTP/dITP diphosphatase [Clostridia bacterium]
MKIVLASRNAHKIKELYAFIAPIDPSIEILSLDDIGFTEDIEENGTTFEENALIKAQAVAARGYIGIADDSGLAVDALNGAPGVYSARYAGEHGDDHRNNMLLLENIRDVADENRTAQFVSVIACAFPDALHAPIVCRGECPGTILHEYRGTGGFGYDPLFYYAPFGKTYAEMIPEEKNQISHRANAMAKFAEAFRTALPDLQMN